MESIQQPPQKQGHRLKLLYMSQVGERPPRFAISVNNRSRVTRDYAYFLENRLRTRFGLDGVPVITHTVGSGSTPNLAYFGDASILGNSKTRIQYVQVEGVPVCAIADIDCSGHVDGTDLATLIGAWGTSLCEADLDEDGIVNGQDLAILLGLWG